MFLHAIAARHEILTHTHTQTNKIQLSLILAPKFDKDRVNTFTFSW